MFTSQIGIEIRRVLKTTRLAEDSPNSLSLGFRSLSKHRSILFISLQHTKNPNAASHSKHDPQGI